MFYFLHSHPRNFKLPRRRLVRLLHELMKKDSAPIHNRTVKDSCDTFGRLDAGDEACRKRQNFCLEAIAVEGDEPSHLLSIANMLYSKRLAALLTTVGGEIRHMADAVLRRRAG